MSSIQSVTSGSNAALAQAAQTRRPPVQAPAQDSAAKEAQETVAVTQAEAARGDQQAARRLALAKEASQPAAPAPSAKGGKGVNVLA